MSLQLEADSKAQIVEVLDLPLLVARPQEVGPTLVWAEPGWATRQVHTSPNLGFFHDVVWNFHDLTTTYKSPLPSLSLKKKETAGEICR